MLRTLGGTLFEFIENLDALHGYLSLSYKVGEYWVQRGWRRILMKGSDQYCLRKEDVVII